MKPTLRCARSGPLLVGARTRLALALASLFAVALLGPPRAGADGAPLAERAAQAFTSQSWTEALPLYEQLVREQPADAQAILRLGLVHLQLGQGAAGLAAIEKAGELGAPPPQVSFRRASAHAVMGDAPAAIAELERAVAAGFVNLNLLRTDPLLASLRGTPELARVETSIDRILNPCKSDPKSREFDYWVGTWDVVPNGAPPGTPLSENIVTLEHGDCIVHEYWKGASGVTGESFNLWDVSQGAWFQTWVDSTGGMHEYKGGLDAAGNMAFTAELAPNPGQAVNERDRVPTKLTFLKLGPDQVRQLSEQSTDGGRIWQIAYDLIYTRRRK